MYNIDKKIIKLIILKQNLLAVKFVYKYQLSWELISCFYFGENKCRIYQNIIIQHKSIKKQQFLVVFLKTWAPIVIRLSQVSFTIFRES